MILTVKISVWYWAIPDKLCPPPPTHPKRMSMLRMQKKVWNSTCYFTIFFQKSRLRKQESLDFGHICGSFLEICVKIRIFVQKPLKSRTIFHQKRSGNPTSSMEGGQNSSGIAHFCQSSWAVRPGQVVLSKIYPLNGGIKSIHTVYFSAFFSHFLRAKKISAQKITRFLQKPSKYVYLG